MKSLSQKERVISLGVDLLVLFSICFLAFGNIYPPLGDEGFWFYAALLSVLVGAKIVTPFYVKPADAISYAVPAFVSLMLINKWDSWSTDIKMAFLFSATIPASILFLSFLAISFNNWKNESLQEASNKVRMFLEVVAKPQVIYTPVVLFAMYAFHLDRPIELILIAIALVLTVAMSIGDEIFANVKKLKKRAGANNIVSNIAEVVAFQQPKITLVRQLRDDVIPIKSVVCVRDKHSNCKLALTLDLVGRENGVLLRAVDIGSLESKKYPDLELAVPLDSVAQLDEKYFNKICELESIDYSSKNDVVGIVAPDTAIQRLYFEVVDNKNLEEGRLVSVYVQGKKVLYQIVGGLTREEVVHQKNTYGYLRAQAQQIGVWDEKLEKFTQFSWLPSLNEPVYIEKQVDYEIDLQTIGHFPGSSYKIKVGDIDQIVTHNTAILGILGIGKSMLAIEMIERMMAKGIKVVCLDLTEQYANELSDYYHSAYEIRCLEKLREAAGSDRDAWQENPEEGGSLPNLKEAFFNRTFTFLGLSTVFCQ